METIQLCPTKNRVPCYSQEEWHYSCNLSCNTVNRHGGACFVKYATALVSGISAVTVWVLWTVTIQEKFEHYRRGILAQPTENLNVTPCLKELHTKLSLLTNLRWDFSEEPETNAFTLKIWSKCWFCLRIKGTYLMGWRPLCKVSCCCFRCFL